MSENDAKLPLLSQAVIWLKKTQPLFHPEPAEPIQIRKIAPKTAQTAAVGREIYPLKDTYTGILAELRQGTIQEDITFLTPV